tara:strand:+ start:1221 stop:2600 length:1380 start_codon:yes stop_codon:yes gene_type:complete
MFTVLSNRFQKIFTSLRGEIRLTPEVVEQSLREIRLALLEADVNFKVVKAFIERVRERTIDKAVLASLTPTQQVISIVRSELQNLLGDDSFNLFNKEQKPQVILMVGLQGSGKTTTTAKLGKWLANHGRHPLMVSTDVHRPAAIEQLNVIAAGAHLRVHDPEGEEDPVKRAESAVNHARTIGCDVLLVDTAGRLHIDSDLMSELERISSVTGSTDRLFVVDGMVGQDAINSAGEFNRRVGVTGVVLSKMDSDTRGGVALSVVGVLGVPVFFNGTGEHVEDFEQFNSSRMISRILGMGDILGLVERAERVGLEGKNQGIAGNSNVSGFNLIEFRRQLCLIKKMGPLDQLIGHLPGFKGNLNQSDGPDPKRLTRMVAIIDSMTCQERLKPVIIKGSRRSRISKGSGVSVQEINQYLKEFTKISKGLKKINRKMNNNLRGKKKKSNRNVNAFDLEKLGQIFQ